jgi:hypothetical protein
MSRVYAASLGVKIVMSQSLFCYISDYTGVIAIILIFYAKPHSFDYYLVSFASCDILIFAMASVRVAE